MLEEALHLGVIWGVWYGMVESYPLFPWWEKGCDKRGGRKVESFQADQSKMSTRGSPGSEVDFFKTVYVHVFPGIHPVWKLKSTEIPLGITIVMFYTNLNRYSFSLGKSAKNVELNHKSFMLTMLIYTPKRWSFEYLGSSLTFSSCIFLDKYSVMLSMPIFSRNFVFIAIVTAKYEFQEINLYTILGIPGLNPRISWTVSQWTREC